MTFGVFLILLVGAGSLFVTLIVWWKLTAPDKAHVELSDRVRSAQTFATAPEKADVKVEGVIVLEATAETEDEALIGPLSGARLAWLKIEVTEDRGGDSFSPLFTLRESRAFSVGSPSVAPAFSMKPVPVAAIPNTIDATDAHSQNTGPVVEPSERMRAFLAKHGKADGSSDGFVRRHEYIEHRLAPGDKVLVVGTKVARSMRAEPSGYRDGDVRTEHELRPDLVRAGAGAEDEIIRKGRRGAFDIGDAIMILIVFAVVASVFGACAGGIYGAVTDSG